MTMLPFRGRCPHCGHDHDADAARFEAMCAERDHLLKVIDFIGTAGTELFPVGPSDTEYAPDGNTVLRHIGPWRFQFSEGETFLAAVENEMKKEAMP